MHAIDARTAARLGKPVWDQPAGQDTGEDAHHRRQRGLGSLIWAAVTSALVASSVAFGNPVATSYLVGLDNSATLWMVQLGGTASAVSLFQTSLAAGANGVAYDAARGDVYAMAPNLDLYRWRDGESQFSVIASGSDIGLASPTPKATGAAFYDDAYWFFVGTSNELRKVSFNYSGPTPTVSSYATYTATAVSTPNGFGDIAINPNTQTLYAYTDAASGGNFYSLDLTTAASGTVGGYNLIATSGSSYQIAFSADYSTLYAHDQPTGMWYTLDTGNGALAPVLTSSGTFTTVGLYDIAGASIQPVPEPDTLALAAMGGGVLAWQVSRRRRKPGEEMDAIGPDDGPPEPLGSDDGT